MTTIIDPTIVLCVPGRWRDRDELTRLISAQPGTFSLDGDHLIDPQSQAKIELQLEAHDPRMSEAFRAVGPHWVDSDAMQKIDAHTSVAYLVGRGGSHPRAISLMLAATSLLRSGGLGIKIESSGIAHSAEAWTQLTDNRHVLTAHEAFIAYVTGDDIYTCGMHSFGLRDAVIAIGEAVNPLELLRIFTWYLFTETPPIRPGLTFSVEDGQPRYRLSEEECTHYGADELFKNQYGMWRLSRIVE
jgi:hypothetical protein